MRSWDLEFLGCNYEDFCLLRCVTVRSGRYVPKFRRNILYPYYMAAAGNKFPRNLGTSLLDYAMSFPQVTNFQIKSLARDINEGI
jgi:hypothetical protein